MRTASSVQRPETILANWERLGLPFQTSPRLLRALSAGQTNRSFLIGADGERFVLRLNAPDAATLGINRQDEARLLTAASAAGIAPAVIHCAPEHGLLITEFIDGRPLHRDDVDRRQIHQLVELLEAVHTLPVELPAFDYAAHAQEYWQHLVVADVPIPPALVKQRKPAMDQLAMLVGPGRRHPCHHDPVPGNVLQHDGRLLLIDWEYAGYGDPAFDWAALVEEWAVPAAALPVVNATRAEALRSAYRFLCALWSLLPRCR